MQLTQTKDKLILGTYVRAIYWSQRFMIQESIVKEFDDRIPLISKTKDLVGYVQKIGKLDRAKVFSRRHCHKSSTEYAD